MTRKSLSDASSEIYKLLEPFDASERARIVRGTLLLLGDQAEMTSQSAAATGSGQPPIGQQQQPLVSNLQGGVLKFFNDKKPIRSSDSLAVAAAYQELSGGGDVATVDSIGAIFDQARRSFIRRNFVRDMENAKIAGFFNKTGKGSYKLSAYGQAFVDALPNRDAANAIDKPKGKRGKSKKRKSSAG